MNRTRSRILSAIELALDPLQVIPPAELETIATDVLDALENEFTLEPKPLPRTPQAPLPGFSNLQAAKDLDIRQIVHADGLIEPPPQTCSFCTFRCGNSWCVLVSNNCKAVEEE